MMILILSVSVFFLFIFIGSMAPNKDGKHLEDTLSIDLDSVSKIEISNLNGNYRTTTNHAEMNVLVDYLSQVQYDRLLNDQTAYMPMNTRIIYLYANDEIDFIITYGKEAMINQKVYQVKDGEINQEFLAEFYHSLANE